MHTSVNFRIWNTFAGLFTFLVSLTIYLLTLEPTVSYWDCGEFLSCATKLEICHAPGSPLFLLVGRIASLFAGNDTSRIALMINASSAVFSALTIMFLCWTITWVGRKILSSTWQSSGVQKITIISAGVIGAMAYAVSDSFWFSAVETEVYALSSLFTAVVFWCATKWEESYKEAHSGRWLMLTAYLFGLGIGVHLLNLLAIPSIVILYYLKKHPFTWKRISVAILVSFGLLGAILVIIPGLPKFFSWCELIYVNKFQWPYNSGYTAGGIIVLLLIGTGFYYSYKKKSWLYNSLVYLTLLIVGFSTYGVIIIRSNDNPSIDMNNPEDPFALEYYLNREQYEKPELLYGPSFASPIIENQERHTYERLAGKYIQTPMIPKYTYDKNTMMFFPRMTGSRPGIAEAYKQWAGIKGKPHTYVNGAGHQETITLPTFGENIRFFFTYQLGHMYFRYFMWNFSGRQNNIQGDGTAIHGNWISGFPIIDKILLGPQDKIPTWLINNRGHNVYYLIPFLLGLLGAWYHYKSAPKNFFVLLLLFFFTGIAIVMFLNEGPIVPRERDYVYTGSFYVFCIWIGIGTLALVSLLQKWLKNQRCGSVLLATGISATIPILMATQNWDDHNRSHRYIVQEYARNYLESCEPNAILFTNADNDTYPLWYAQEVEGIRRDVQIVLFPYLSASWYVNQIRCSPGKPQGINLSIPPEQIAGGKRSFLPVIKQIDSTVDINSLLDFIKSEDSRTKISLSNGENVNYIPAQKLGLKVNQHYIRDYKFKSGQPLPYEDSILIALHEHYVMQDQLILFDILATNNWKRPVYFASVQEPMRLGLEKYLQLDGYAYKLTPFKSNPKDISEIGIVDSETLYNKYFYKLNFSSLSNPNVYLDHTHIHNLSVLSLQNKFAKLAQTLLNEGKTEKALHVLDKTGIILVNNQIPYNQEWLRIACLYIEAGEREKGEEILKKLRAGAASYLEYFQTLSRRKIPQTELQSNIFTIYEIMQISQQYHINNINKDISAYWKQLENTLLPFLER